MSIYLKARLVVTCSRCGLEAECAADVRIDARTGNLFLPNQERDLDLPNGWERCRLDPYDKHGSAICPECVSKRHSF